MMPPVRAATSTEQSRRRSAAPDGSQCGFGESEHTPNARCSLSPKQLGPKTGLAITDGQVSPHRPPQNPAAGCAPSPHGASGGPSTNTVPSEYTHSAVAHGSPSRSRIQRQYSGSTQSSPSSSWAQTRPPRQYFSV